MSVSLEQSVNRSQPPSVGLCMSALISCSFWPTAREDYGWVPQRIQHSPKSSPNSERFDPLSSSKRDKLEGQLGGRRGDVTRNYQRGLDGGRAQTGQGSQTPGGGCSDHIRQTDSIPQASGGSPDVQGRTGRTGTVRCSGWSSPWIKIKHRWTSSAAGWTPLPSPTRHPPRPS